MKFFWLAATLLLWPVDSAAQEHVDKRECIVAHTEAQRRERDGKLIGARVALDLCSRPDCPGPIRSECTQWLAAVSLRIPTVVFEVLDAEGRPADGSFTDGGVAMTAAAVGVPLEVDPGMHRFRAIPATGPAVEVNVYVHEGVFRQTVTFQLPKPSAERNVDEPTKASGVAPARSRDPLRPLPGDDDAHQATRNASLPLATIGLGALGSFGYFSLAGLAKQRELEGHCAPACHPDDVRAMRTRYTVADVSLGVAAVLLGAAFIVERQRKTSRSVAHGTVEPAPTSRIDERSPAPETAATTAQDP